MMLKVCDENRERIEREFLALVLNKNEVIDLLQIKPKALHNKDNQKLLEYAIECYKTNKVVTPTEIVKLHSNFDVEYFTDIISNFCEWLRVKVYKSFVENAGNVPEFHGRTQFSHSHTLGLT